MLRALGSAADLRLGDIAHDTGGMSFYEYWVPRLVISLTRQGVRFVTGIGFASCEITHETGVRFVTGIGFCVL